ncbi:MAG: methylenetetrahydrofolate reductase [Acidimicrobiia bacterium]
MLPPPYRSVWPPDSSPVPVPVPLTFDEPALVVDVRAPLRWPGDALGLWRRTAAAVSGCIALVGDHADNPPAHDDTGRLPPEEVIAVLLDAGVRAIVTVTGRSHSPADVRRLVRSCRDAGALAVHVVTGDHPRALGIDRAVRFGTESLRMLPEAPRAAVAATVAESPAAPGDRVGRLLAKQRAGASACILNHSGDAGALIAFVDRCREAGVTMPMIAPVPMVADRHAALRLAAFPGLRLPTGFLAGIADAADPAAHGPALAAELAATLVRSGRFAGVNLSGGAAGITPDERLAATAAVITATRAALTERASG